MKKLIFHALQNQRIREAKILENIKGMIKNDELEIYYQPQFNSITGKIFAMEALIRWNNKELGMVMPDEFIDIIESNGYINYVGDFIIENVCRQNKVWKDKGYDYKYIAVNISPIQLQNRIFVKKIKDVLYKNKLKPQWLQLEITENIFINCLECAIEILEELSKIGVKIALDDFGKGYSSLNYLRILPIDTLKIDKSFMDEICVDVKQKAIVKCIIDIGNILDLNVISEGIETKKQVEMLKNLHCNNIQGYYFSKALNKQNMEEMLKKYS